MDGEAGKRREKETAGNGHGSDQSLADPSNEQALHPSCHIEADGRNPLPAALEENPACLLPGHVSLRVNEPAGSRASSALFKCHAHAIAGGKVKSLPDDHLPAWSAHPCAPPQRLRHRGLPAPLPATCHPKESPTTDENEAGSTGPSSSNPPTQCIQPSLAADLWKVSRVTGHTAEQSTRIHPVFFNPRQARD